MPETALTFTLYGNSLYVVVPHTPEPAPNPCESAVGSLMCSIGIAQAPEASAQPVQALQVQRRFVETGERRDGQVVIRKGLKAGEQIVTAGQLKLDNGASVSLSDDQSLSENANSQPAAN